MAQTYILTFIATDRPGLVETLSDTVSENGGNWLESRMAHLAEKFAGIARFEAPKDKEQGLRDALMALEAEGFHIAVEASGDDDPDQPTGTLFTIDLVGPDQPGIVRGISHCLADRGMSVEEMETDIRDAPMSGGAHFYARITARAPAGLDGNDLRDALEDVADALMVDIEMREDAAAG